MLLARRMDASERTVHRALGILEDRGWITVRKENDPKGYRDANSYTIHHPLDRYPDDKRESHEWDVWKPNGKICNVQTAISADEG